VITTEDGQSIEVPQFTFNDRRFVFLHASEPHSLISVSVLLRKNRPSCFNDEGILEIVVGISGVKGGEEHANAGLGIRVENSHSAIARLLRLPERWRDAQLNSLTQTLRPVLVDGKSKAVSLLAVFPDGRRREAPGWISKYLSWQKDSRTKKLVYFKAEAGKGKSTTLADLTYSRLEVAAGPIPLFLPLRNLERGLGISWGGIAERLGIVNADAETLSLAVQAGMVLLVLDGLDEVSGRHNPVLVSQVVDLVVRKALSGSSLVVISGRTTEGSFIDSSTAITVNLELPDVNDKSFSDYVEIVIGDITSGWDETSRKLPEPRLEISPPNVASPGKAERVMIRDWIRESFDKLGKDRSLFFVQGLAWIGRSRQLHGNKPLIITGQILEIPSIFDVCVLAASLACVREQGKVDSISRDIFTPVKQLDLLTIFSVVASIDSGHWNVATPNELAQRVFEVDPTHQNEEFSSILHQMQKHALLFSRHDENSTGDWKPSFLSDWVRNALLARAWRDRDRLSLLTKGAHEFHDLIASARDAKLAFHEIFPSLLSDIDEIERILEIARCAANSGSPEAAANYWSLIAGLAIRPATLYPPERIPEFTDFSSAEFEDIEFDHRFSGSFSLFCDVEFSDCVFKNCEFVEAELPGARFLNCRFVDVHWTSCWGAASFDSCEFEGCRFVASRSKEDPPWSFIESNFERTFFQQQNLVIDDRYVKLCVFEDCVSSDDVGVMFDGAGLGFEPERVEGLGPQGTGVQRSFAQQCLRAMLKPFFPRRMGEGGEIQARRYIRSSALGRGVLPAMSPPAPVLLQFLEAEGFSTGGRTAHIYAPWSSVVGAGDNAIVLRNELIEFMRTDKESRTVKRILEKIRKSANWE
jgi:uncharacterized protein YjbI with pentapeptide repeats